MQECFVHERDMYMAIKMREVWSPMQYHHIIVRYQTVEASKGDMVAVVGARHILGIIAQWSNTDDEKWRKTTIAELDKMPGSAQLPMREFR